MNEREKTIEKLHIQMDDVDEMLNQLEARREMIRSNMRTAYAERLVALRAQRDKLNELFGQMEQAEGEHLEWLVSEFKAVRSALTASIQVSESQYLR